jgi:hypothetical protein
MLITNPWNVEAAFNLFSHLENHISRVSWTLKTFFKNFFVSPGPQVPACYHESRSPVYFTHSTKIVVNILEYPIPAR